MAIEFEAFALNGHHCPIWAMDIMIALVSRGIMCAILDSPLVRITPLTEKWCLIYHKALDSDLNIWLFCISNSWDTMNLKGKGLNLTSTFNPTSPAVTGPYGHGECDG